MTFVHYDFCYIPSEQSLYNTQQKNLKQEFCFQSLTKSLQITLQNTPQKGPSEPVVNSVEDSFLLCYCRVFPKFAYLLTLAFYF